MVLLEIACLKCDRKTPLLAVGVGSTGDFLY